MRPEALKLPVLVLAVAVVGCGRGERSSTANADNPPAKAVPKVGDTSGGVTEVEPKSLREEAERILRERFPDAAFTENSIGELEYRSKCREFQIYMLYKTGEWQEAVPTIAPDRGGISVRFRVADGRWKGALAIPHSGTQDFHVFKRSLVVKNSVDGKRHIWAEVLTPKVDPPVEIKKRLLSLFHDFERYGEHPTK